jgi:transcriptional regulator with XRE-family HTH domain
MTTRPLGEVLRELRNRQGTSLRAAARELGVDPAHLSRLERAEKPVSDQVLSRASRYYAVPLEELERARGEVPRDVIEILQRHPDLIESLRKEYGSR